MKEVLLCSKEIPTFLKTKLDFDHSYFLIFFYTNIVKSHSVKSVWKQTISKIKFLQLKKTLQIQLWLELYFWNRERISELSLPFPSHSNEFEMDVRSSDFIISLFHSYCNYMGLVVIQFSKSNINFIID